MQATEFHDELKKYKLLRKPDHYKVKWNRKQTEKREMRLNDDNEATTIDKSSVETDAGFWELLEAATKSIFPTTAERNKFFNALRNEHNTMHTKVNLTDLDKLAAITMAEN